jgi:signal transduction histidine kinase
LGNVIKNAIAYSTQGASVFVHASRLGNKVQFEIRDTGIGISEEELPKIFDRFWRSDKARSYTSGGNGLGLAIAKSIADRYQGTTTVKSKLGKGTSVYIAFQQRR